MRIDFAVEYENYGAKTGETVAKSAIDDVYSVVGRVICRLAPPEGEVPTAMRPL
jgi:hypothetical protein